MPDPYQNPDRKPPHSSSWVPNQTPTGNGTAFGYAATTLVRGRFRNDLPVATGYSDGTLTLTFSGDRQSDAGSEGWPILSAFRPLQNPTGVRGSPPAMPFVVRGDFQWKAALATSARLSAITFTYSLTVDINDTTLDSHLSEEDLAIVQQLRAGNAGAGTVDWGKYMFGQVLADGDEFPAFVDDKPVQFPITDLETAGEGAKRSTITVKFGTSTIVNDYPTRSSVTLKARHPITSLKLRLYDVRLFDAARVNLREDQLPCSALAYAFPIRFNYDPIAGRPQFPPGNAYTPNFHAKLFHPEHLTSSPGWAHSMVLRFLIYSQRISGIDPTGLDNLFFVVFIGPMASGRLLRYSLYARAAGSVPGRTIPLDINPLADNARLITIQKSETPGDSAPADGSDFTELEGSQYDLQAPPSFSPNGPYVAPFLFVDTAGTTKDWYRLKIKTNDGSESFGPWFRSQYYIERAVSRLTRDVLGNYTPETVYKRPPILSTIDWRVQEPLAVFYAQDEEFPLTNPVNIGRGAWKLAIKAGCADAQEWLSTHVYARFWFVPENETPSYPNIHAWRDQTEYHFVTTAEGTVLRKGAPTSFDQVILSPPLPDEPAFMELVRYIDGVEGGENVTIPIGTGRARMVVGLYSFATLTSDGEAAGVTTNTPNLPKIKLEIDPLTNAFDTTVRQILSDTIEPTRVPNYTAAVYAPLTKPLYLSRTLIGVGEATSEGSDWYRYSRVFQASSNNNPRYAFLNLLALESGNVQTPKIALPFTSIPNQREEGAVVIADFATNDRTLLSGRVNAGPWTIRFTPDLRLDNEKVKIDIRLEAMLVTSDGRVMERIFRSPYIPWEGGSVQYTMNVQIPFTIASQDCQLVMRLYAYPHSADPNTPVNIQELSQQLEALEGKPPLGLRISQMAITDHTIGWLNLQGGAGTTRPGFYEDLPLVPNRAFDDNAFYLLATPDMEQTQIVSGNAGFDVTACLHSPAWAITCPTDMEVQCAGGVFGNTLWFRTVPTELGTVEETSLTAVEDDLTGAAHLAFDEQEPTTQSVGMQSLTGRSIRHQRLPTPMSRAWDEGLVSGRSAGANVTLEGKHPNLVTFSTGIGTVPDNLLGVVSHIDLNQTSAFNLALSARNGVQGGWIGPNRDLGDDAFSAQRKLVEGLELPAVCTDGLKHTLYAAGYVSDGYIVMKSAQAWDAGRSSQIAEGRLLVVDGEGEIRMGSNQTPVLPKGSLNGKVARTFPGIVRHGLGGTIVVAYALEGRAGDIVARNFDGTAFGQSYVLASLRSPSVGISGDLAINSPALAYDPLTGSVFVAFWCAGKIFLTMGAVRGVDQHILRPCQLVAGSSDFTSSTNSANGYFAALKTNQQIIVSRAGADERDVPSQRVGILVSKRPGYSGGVVIYYRDADDKVRARYVRYLSQVSDSVLLS